MIKDWRCLKSYMNRDFDINDIICSARTNNNDILDVIQSCKILLRRADGEYKTVEAVAKELSHCMTKCFELSDVRRIGDAAIGLLKNIVSLEEPTASLSEELDVFLQRFKVKDKEVVL